MQRKNTYTYLKYCLILHIYLCRKQAFWCNEELGNHNFSSHLRVATYYSVWWRGHSSKYFFIKWKLSIILWGSMFVLRISLNFFTGTSKTSFNLDFKTGGKFVCFDLLVVGASSSLLYAKLITKNCQKNFPNWNWFYMFQQKNSKKLLR